MVALSAWKRLLVLPLLEDEDELLLEEELLDEELELPKLIEPKSI